MAASTPGRGTDSTFGAAGLEPEPGALLRAAGIGWRRRALMVAALIGCLSMFALVRWLAAAPQLDAQWGSSAQGGLVLQNSPLPALRSRQGHALVAISDGVGTARPVDTLLLQRSPRWQVNDAARARQVEQHGLLAERLASGAVELWFDDGIRLTVQAQPRGYGGLGLLLWPLASLALALYLIGVVVVLAKADMRNLLYLTMSVCQAANLLLIALEATPGLSLPLGAGTSGLDLRLALDACTGAAIVHAFAIHPLRLPRAGAIAITTWAGVVLVLMLMQGGLLSPAWWWAQGLCLGLGLAALAVIDHSVRIEANPHAIVMRRFCLIALATLVLVTAAVATAWRLPEVAHGVALGASVAWYLFLASLLLLTPFLSRSRQLLREFALLAGISTVAASVDLLFVAVFSLGPFTSLAVAVFAALAVYTAARQYILNRMLGSQTLSTERTFDLLYSAAREVQAQPRHYPQVLGQLLRDLFEPLELVRVQRVPARALVVNGGAALVVPVRQTEADRPATTALQLRFAQRGQRLFTREDARLADRVLEQLRRAVTLDQAVERGRHEERQRIAQDLHDDIGARLLTLMYQAPTPEIEDYIRHTLQDLKTLTRGLAASEHPLSHAAAEWKADLSQRLTVAQAQLGWAFSFDEDLRLSMVQWSALTRVLRELVSNALYHGKATRVDVNFQLEGAKLSLSVSDDGHGREPQAWSHGLGLGGVRKRVKLLGGAVQWRENDGHGIVCEVSIEAFKLQV